MQKKQDILRIQYLIPNKMQVEAVNFLLYFKVIIRQNEIQYFTTHIWCTLVWHTVAYWYIWESMQLGSLLVQWANFSLSVNMLNS